MTATQTKLAPPPPPAKAAPARPTQSRTFTIGKAVANQGRRVCIYGPGGIGKTTLASLADGPLAAYDLDGSLGVLGLDVPTIDAPDWSAITASLDADIWGDVRTIIIDSATKAEELCAAWVLQNVKGDKGNAVTRLEDYGYGKGLCHVYETFLGLLARLDRHVAAGRNVVLIAHDCTASVPNPMGEDYLRYEPRLQSPASGKNSIRHRVREWADHLLFVGYDVVAKDGKARGSGSRTLYPQETPFCMAKSRKLREPIAVVEGDRSVWDQILG